MICSRKLLFFGVMTWTVLGCRAMMIAKQQLKSCPGVYIQTRLPLRMTECSDVQTSVLGRRRDGWINTILLGESTHSSLFQTANNVVNHFLSSNEHPAYPLRRIWSFDQHLSIEDKETELFAPLFGSYTDHSSSATDVNLNKKSKRKRINLKMTVVYRGKDFCGWEDQRHHIYRMNPVEQSIDQNILPSVQGTLVDVLDPVFGRLFDEHSSYQRDQNTSPVEIKVAGRTDAGVNAVGQICRIRTWRTDLPNGQSIDEIEDYVKDLVNEHANKLGVGLRVTNVQKIGNQFHPTFGATCRAYAYLVDLQNEDSEPRITRDIVAKLDSMLRALESRTLNYVALSYGKVKTQTTDCTLIRARATLVECTVSKKEAVCIELIGDRFLRRMVRILVATALREACADTARDESLLKVLNTRDRTNSAPAAPPDGLIFVGAGY
ncbi:hypothetical protein ACHAXN_006824 [Cyclotella atomus]